MKKTLLILVPLLAYVSSIYSAEHHVLDLKTMLLTERKVDTTPIISQQNVGDSLYVTLTFKYVNIILNDNGTSSIIIPGFFENSSPGEYIYPSRTINYRISEGSYPYVAIRNHEYLEYPLTLDVASDPIPDTANHSTKTPVAISTNGFEPANIINPDSHLHFYRGNAFLPITISPVQYDSQSHIARICTTLTYVVAEVNDMHKSVSQFPSEISKANIMPDDSFMEEFTLPVKLNENEKEFKTGDDTLGGVILPEMTQETYLILTTSALRPAADKLALWKKMLGYDVITYNNISTQPWTQESIKQRIKTIYLQHPNLTYVLLIGDSATVPGIKRQVPLSPLTSPEFYYTDFPYSCLDGEDDDTSDVNIGRIPASTLQEAMNAVKKTIEYEMHPNMDVSFYNSAVHISNFEEKNPNSITIDGREIELKGEEDRMFVYTSEEIRKKLSQNCKINVQRLYTAKTPTTNPAYWSRTFVSRESLKSIPDELKRPNFKWEAKVSDYEEAINKGVLYLLYRGHGSVTSWNTPVNFSSSNVLQNLTNTGCYPLLFSITCNTGAYNLDPMCLSKAFLVAPESGAAGAICASSKSYSGPNDILTGALFRAIWPQSNIEIFPYDIVLANSNAATKDLFNQTSNTAKHNLGKILNFGLQATSQCYNPNNFYRVMTNGLFHVFGDPSLEINTQKPKIINEISVIKCDNGFDIKGNYKDFPNGAILTVVDTVQSKLFSRQILNDTFVNIPLSVQDRYKITISGRGLKPLVIEGSKGYSGGWTKKTPGIVSSNYIDFKTGNRCLKEVSPASPGINYKEDSNGIITAEIEGAYIVTDPYAPEYESWEIAGAMQYWALEKPIVVFDNYYMSSYEKADNIDVELIDCTYIDIPNAKCMPYYLLPDCDSEYVLYDVITPYEGFYPETVSSLRNSTFEDDEGRLYLDIFPIQYDYVNKTMRCYSMMKFKRSDVSEVNELSVEKENNAVIYYTIDGRIVSNPQNGSVYIRQRGDKRDKILF